MGRKLIAVLFVLALTGSAAADQADFNKTYNETIDMTPKDQAIYDLNEPEEIEILVETNRTAEVQEAVLQTDEGLETMNYTRYTVNVDENANGTDIKYIWDNQHPVTIPKTVDYQPYIEFEDETLTINESEYNSTIKVVSQPTIVNFTMPEEVGQNQLAEISLKATHPVGYGSIERVKFFITTPEGEQYEHIARRENQIVVNGDTGNLFETVFTNTAERGNYQVEAVLITEEQEITTSDSFRVVNGVEGQSFDSGVSVSPMSIGSTSWTKAGADITKTRYILYTAGGLTGLNLLVVVAVLIGGGGYDENYFDQPNPPPQNY